MTNAHGWLMKMAALKPTLDALDAECNDDNVDWVSYDEARTDVNESLAELAHEAHDIIERLSELIDAWGPMTCGDIGPHLTCYEMEVLEDLFTSAGATAQAKYLHEGHAFEDDEDDSHFGEYGEVRASG